MKKRVLSVLLALVMLLSLLPTGAFALETEPAHDHTGWTAVTMGTGHIKLDGTELSANILPDGNYYLDGDITISPPLLISGTVSLCLNGHSITSTGNTIKVDSNCSLTIWDCSAGGAGKIIGASRSIDNYGTLTLYSGRLEGGNATNGYGVNNSDPDSVFKLFGGSVSGELYGIFNVFPGSQIYLSGTPSVSGGTADIHTNNSSSKIYADGGEETPTPYSGEAISLHYYSLSPGNILVYNVTATTKDKFTLTNEGYCLEQKTVNGETCLVAAVGRPAHTHAVCGETCGHEGEDAHAQAVTYTALTQAVVDSYKPTEHTDYDFEGRPVVDYEFITIPAGNYYLAEDITTDKMVELGGAVNLCFNGHTFTSTLTGTSGDCGALMLADNATLNTCDCQGGGGFIDDGQYVLVIRGTNATVNLYGGEFTGRIPVRVGVTSATLTVDGATLTAGTTALEAISGKVTVKSGQITNQDDYWGAVDIRCNDFTVTGGTIKNTGKGPALQIWAAQPVKLSGSPVIQGGEKGDISLQYKTCKLTVGEDLTGTYLVGTYYDVTEDAPWTITTPADADQSAHFTSATSGVSVQDVVDEDGKHTVQLYKIPAPAPAPHTHAMSVGCETEGENLLTYTALTSEDGKLYVDGVAAEESNKNGGPFYILPPGNYYLAEDVALDKTLQVFALETEGTMDLCLNGHELKYMGTAAQRNVINMGKINYGINLCDCAPDGGSHTITSPVTGATLSISGGLITGGSTSGVNANFVNLYGGTIAGNGGDTTYGGGVDVNSSFAMGGGAIIHNKGYAGGGVSAGPSFTMTGGTIRDNWATNMSGGVHTYNNTTSSPKSVTLSGDVKIMGNTAGADKAPSNLRLANGVIVTVDQALGSAAQVGISTSTAPTATAPVTVATPGENYTITETDLAKFSSDNDTYHLELVEGDLLLARDPDHTHTWATTWTSDANGHWHACTADGCSITDYANCGETGAAYAAHSPGDWQTDGANHWKTCSVCGYELSKAAHGYDDDQDAICNTCGYTRTLTPIDPGPGEEDGNVTGEVEVKGDTPAVTVDKNTLKDLAGDVEEGDTVTVKLTVEKQDDPADKAELESIISGEKGEVLYLDLSLFKQVNDEEPEPITDTQDKVLAVVVPYDFTGKTDVTVYRKHGTEEAETLTKLTARPAENFADGTFFADSANGAVYIYASKFSTYAIGYTAETTTPVTPNRPVTVIQPAEETPTWPFEDVAEGDWFYESVKYVYEKGLMEGTSDTAFSPDWDTSRAMIATIIWRLAGSPEVEAEPIYPDCDGEGWYAAAVAWGTEQGVIEGYEDGNFGPDDPITREQLAAMLYRYAGSPATAGTLEDFADGETAGSWAVDALRWAVEVGVLQGKDGNILDPTGKATRAEAAAMLRRFCGIEK